MRQHFYPLLLVGLLAAVSVRVVLQPDHLLYPRGGQATDLTITHWPAVAFNAQTLREYGQVPLWRTTIASGGPWAANPQSWLFYPPAWLFFLLPPNLTFNLLLLGHLALAAAATYVLGRRGLALQPPGAALAALGFVLSPWLSAQLAAGHVNIAFALAWLPVALLGAHEAVQAEGGRGPILVGVAWAAALLTHAQTAFFCVVVTVAWMGWAALRRGAPRAWLKMGSRMLLAAGICLFLSAALLVPLAEALPYLNRGELTLEEAGVFSVPWAQLVTTAIPTYGGEPELNVYIGIPLALLAAAALVLARGRGSWLLVAIALVAGFFALGTHAPLFPALFRLLPGIQWLRVPARAWMLVSFALAMLAGQGLDALAERPLSRIARSRATIVALGGLTAGVVLAAGLAILFRPISPAVWSLAAFAILSGALMLGRIRGRIGPRPFQIAAVLLVTTDLALVHFAWTEMRSPEEAFAWGADPAGYLAREPGRFRVYSPDYSLPQHTAFEHGLFLADGVDPFQLASYADFLAQAGGYETDGYSPSLPPDLTSADAKPVPEQLGLLNVAYVASAFPLEVEGLVQETQVGGTYIYGNERALPRAFFVPMLSPVTDADISLRWPIVASPAGIVSYTPNRIVVRADLPEPALLVLAEVWYPGWQAEVNGTRLPIRRVEGVLRGVNLEAGAHTIEFEYRPWTVPVGLSLSVGTALALLAFGAYRFWRHP